MKKLILILTIFLLVSNVFAISLNEVNEENIKDLTEEDLKSLYEEYNSLPEEEKAVYDAQLTAIQTEISSAIQDVSIKELLETYLEQAGPIEIPEAAKRFLPLNVKVNILDKEESFIIVLDQKGEISLQEEGKYHILIEFNLEDVMQTVIQMQLGNQIDQTQIIEKITIIPNSFKGALVLNAAERILGMQLVKQRSFGYKTVGVLTAPVSWFAK